MFSTATLVQSPQDTEYISSKQSPMYNYPQPSSTFSSSASHLTRTNTDTTEVLASVGSSRHASDDEHDGHFHQPASFAHKELAQPPSPRTFQLDQSPQQQNNARKPVEPMPDLDINELVQNFQNHQLHTPPRSPSGQAAGSAIPTSPQAKHGHHGFFLRRKDSKMATSKKSKKSGVKTSHGVFHGLKRFLRTGTSSSVSSVQTSPRLMPAEPKHHHNHAHGNAFETDLHKKYGKMGRVLGHGAGGTVRILTRVSDNKTFAIKQFRKRRNTEPERIYTKKIMAEYTLGSTFHHPNIIETIDIVKEGDSFYEVMEYARYELFSAVMDGDMEREEIACCFHGVVQGVAYLHEMGVAHRDLKLDNCVMNEDALVKIIDFGCSMVCQLPFEKHPAMARGISGSDPYIAPEVFTTDEHDAQPADVWSLGIIFVCMTIGRFPWKIPRLDEDESFEAFAKGDKGKQRVLKLLPRESRPIMSRILEVDPLKRATIKDVLADPWFQSIDACTVDHKSSNHPHHLGDDDGVTLREPHPKVAEN
ncbi:hypothetical protein BG004_002530 [Podila humilis]|nr:hypothetical protein BG004_002530 [Podila humilis]